MTEIISIGSQPYNVYADLATAKTYMDAAFQGDSWPTATDLTKSKGLITATRTLDRQNWKGEKLDPDQPLQFPRKNMGIEGLDDSLGVTPEGIITGSIELASAIIDGSDVQDQKSIAERVRSLTAGSVSISNFRGVDSTFLGSGAPRFPIIVQELVGPYLAGSNEFGAAKATGVCEESKFPGNYGFNRGV